MKKVKRNLKNTCQSLFGPRILPLILCILFLNWSPELHAQNEQGHLEDQSFSERLWFGGNLNPGFSGGNASSLFFVSLAPMAGYKMFKGFSAGPRLSFTYSSYKYKDFNETLKMNTVDYSIGLFTRYKFFSRVFGHFEYGVESVKIPQYNNNGEFKTDGNKILTESVLLDNLYLGAGYNSGGKFGSEILLLYNFMIPGNSIEQPFEIRVGFTYNF